MIDQGIICSTRYCGPTNYRPSRVIATIRAAIGTVRATVSWDHGLNAEENHYAAAQACFVKLQAKRIAWAKARGLREPAASFHIFARGYDDGPAYIFLGTHREAV